MNLLVLILSEENPFQEPYGTIYAMVFNCIISKEVVIAKLQIILGKRQKVNLERLTQPRKKNGGLLIHNNIECQVVMTRLLSMLFSNLFSENTLLLENSSNIVRRSCDFDPKQLNM